MKTNFYLYQIYPIDLWYGWQTADVFRVTHPAEVVDEYQSLLANAEALARTLGWCGDKREGPYVSGLPAEVICGIMIAWKEDSNGTTYVASPFQIPWLTDSTIAEAQGEYEAHLDPYDE